MESKDKAKNYWKNCSWDWSDAKVNGDRRIIKHLKKDSSKRRRLIIKAQTRDELNNFEKVDWNIDILQVAKFFYDKTKNDDLSHKKIQNLSYFAYKWYLILNYDPEMPTEINVLVADKPEAWVHGPTFRKIYDDFIADYSKIIDCEDIEDKEILSFLEKVFAEYGKYHGGDLESIAMQDIAWTNKRVGYDDFDSCNETLDILDILREKYII